MVIEEDVASAMSRQATGGHHRRTYGVAVRRKCPTFTHSVRPTRHPLRERLVHVPEQRGPRAVAADARRAARRGRLRPPRDDVVGELGHRGRGVAAQHVDLAERSTAAAYSSAVSTCGVHGAANGVIPAAAGRRRRTRTAGRRWSTDLPVGQAARRAGRTPATAPATSTLPGMAYVGVGMRGEQLGVLLAHRLVDHRGRIVEPRTTASRANARISPGGRAVRSATNRAPPRVRTPRPRMPRAGSA